MKVNRFIEVNKMVNEMVKNLNIELPEDLHTKLKIQCAERKKTLKDYVIELLTKTTKSL